jgi:hypothetical protein
MVQTLAANRANDPLEVRARGTHAAAALVAFPVLPEYPQCDLFRF